MSGAVKEITVRVGSDQAPAQRFVGRAAWALRHLIDAGNDGCTPISRSTLWRWVRAGRFPAPHKIGPNVTAWRAEEVREFMAKAEGSGEQAAA